MKVESFESLELCDLRLPSLPPRSRLYSLQPIGIGTPMVESLSSYITRLAEAHCLFPKSLIGQVFISVSSKQYKSTDLFGLRQYTGSFNGIGVVAEELVQCLQSLTLRNDLALLTFLPYSNVFPERKLIRQHQLWCPQCYEDRKSSGQVLYQPLLWSTEVVKFCRQHNQVLLSQCPYCSRKLPLLSSYSRVGYCSKCFGWLGVEGNIQLSNSPENISQQVWLIDNLGQLLATASSSDSSFLTALSVAQALSACISQITQGNMAAFARLLNLSKNTLWMWQSGQVSPQLSKLLSICYQLNLSLIDFLSLARSEMSFCLVTSTLKDKQLARPLFKPRVKLDTELIHQALLSVLASKEVPPPPMTEVAKQIGRNKRVIHRHFPQLCKAISAKHLDYRNKQRQQQIRESCERVCRIARSLHSKGVYPSEAQVSKFLEHPGMFRDPEVRAALKAIQKELNCQNHSALVN